MTNALLKAVLAATAFVAGTCMSFDHAPRGVLASAHAADMSEAERFERCANNRQRYDALVAERAAKAYPSDEEIARLRAELKSVQEVSHRIKPGTSFLDDDAIRAVKQVFELGVERYHLKNCKLSSGETAHCRRELIAAISERINYGVSVRPARVALEREIARHATNLRALQCDTARPPEAADIAGRFGSLQGKLEQSRFAAAYADISVLLARYGDSNGWIDGMDSSVPGDPGRGVSNWSAHNAHVMNNGGGGVAGLVSARLSDLRHRLSPGTYAAMEHEASGVLKSYGG